MKKKLKERKNEQIPLSIVYLNKVEIPQGF